MIMIDLTQIAVALIGLVSAVLTAVLIPYIRIKIGNEKWNQLQAIVEVAVKAAEQLGYTQVIEDKFTYVFDLVAEELNKKNITFDSDVVRAAIEAAVKENFGKEW